MLDAISLSLGGVAGTDKSTTDARNSLADTYSQFLTLLTTQLKHQDPLDPMDSKDMTNQLIQLSNTEQQIAQTDKLNEILMVNQASAVNMALNYIGKEVDYVGGDMEYAGTPVNIKYYLEKEAEQTKISIRDADDNVVFTTDGVTDPGSNSFVWNGKDSDGNQLPAGQYKVEVGAQDADEKAVQTYTIVPAIVKSVETAGGQVLLMINGKQVSIGAVQAVRNPAEATPNNNNAAEDNAA